MPLTDIQIRNATSGGTRRRLYDERGLYLELAPAGGKWWRFKYRFGGKEKLLSLGTYPEVPLAGRWVDKAKQKEKDRTGYLKGARDLRDEAREQLAAGVDPSAARKADRAARDADSQRAGNTFEVVAALWLKFRASAWKPGTREAIEASLRNHAYPEIGAEPIDSITPRQVRQLVQKVEAAGAGDLALRVFQRVRSVFRFAVTEELIEADPTYSLKPAEIFRPRAVQHRASLPEGEMPAFFARLSGYDGGITTRAALELLILTAVRPGELRGARWDEFDIDRKLWRIGAERMKMKTEHLVPLSKQALAVLEQMQPISGGDVLVFPSPYYPGKPLSENTLSSALTRLGYKGFATAHGFRTLFSTCANEAGWSGDLVEKQLAHEERDAVRAAYNRAVHLASRTRLMDWWGECVDKFKGGAGSVPAAATSISEGSTATTTA